VITKIPGYKLEYEWLPANGIGNHPVNSATWAVLSNGISGCWELSDSADNTLLAALKVPTYMARGLPSSICVGWSSPVISGDCYFLASYLKTAVDDDTDAAATDSNGALYTSSGTADGLIISSLITIAADALAADIVCLHVAVTRDVSEDALGDVANVHGMAFGHYVKN